MIRIDPVNTLDNPSLISPHDNTKIGIPKSKFEAIG